MGTYPEVRTEVGDKVLRKSVPKLGNVKVSAYGPYRVIREVGMQFATGNIETRKTVKAS